MKTINQVIGNPVGAIAGGLVFFYGSKKMGVQNTYGIAVLTTIGVIGGAMSQKAISAKMSAPTSQTIKG